MTLTMGEEGYHTAPPHKLMTVLYLTAVLGSRYYSDPHFTSAGVGKVSGWQGSTACRTEAGSRLRQWPRGWRSPVTTVRRAPVLPSS